MGKILVFLFDGMTDYEVTFICHVLNTDAGKDIITVAYEDRMIQAQSGFNFEPDCTLAEVVDVEAEALILCGGREVDIKPSLMKLIQRYHTERRLLAAIGAAGTVMLAKSEVLDEVTYTTPVTEWSTNYQYVYGIHDPFPRDNYIEKRLVRDRHVITAQSIAFLDFTLEICAWFKLFQSHQEKHAFAKFVKGA
ncbi:MAG: DJ-1/PfpI family protein [Turicibacter sp.]|nr:DJ-1/PfpI family protein [Turicibacter sp.]